MPYQRSFTVRLGALGAHGAAVVLGLALVGLPTFAMFAGVGFNPIWEWVLSYNFVGKVVATVAILAVYFVVFLAMYVLSLAMLEDRVGEKWFDGLKTKARKMWTSHDS
ncbi:hypothetical protein [Corynebacterium sp. H113]|uniref:hypothetical protein n=1 Tax=Corynebacterium sp. H113 TaxID=3133419 RepID=UPI0030B27585